MAVGCVKVQGAGNNVEVAVWEELEKSKSPRLAFDRIRGPGEHQRRARTFILSDLAARGLGFVYKDAVRL